MTFLGHRLFKHHVHRRDDPRGTPYYWIGGVPDHAQDIPGSDCNAVAEDLISVSPLSVDQTHLSALKKHLLDFSIPEVERTPSVTPPDELELIPPV